MKLGEAIYKSQQKDAKPDASKGDAQKMIKEKKTTMLLMQTLKK